MSNSISISITDSGDHTGITRMISDIDPLASIIDAVVAAVRAEGHDDDSRFQELQDLWRTMNDDSIDEASDDTEDGWDEDWSDSLKSDFRVDDIVFVAHVVDDSNRVLGKTGRIVKIQGVDCAMVAFPGWQEGWSWSKVDEVECYWNVPTSALELRYRPSF